MPRSPRCRRRPRAGCPANNLVAAFALKRRRGRAVLLRLLSSLPSGCGPPGHDVPRRGRGVVPRPQDESDGGRAMPAMRERMRTAGSAVVTLACFGAICSVLIYLHRYSLGGLAVDREAIRGWLAGDGLYAYRSPVSRLGTDLPPVAAGLLAVGVFVPLTVAGLLLGLAGLAALVLALVALVGPVAR